MAQPMRTNARAVTLFEIIVTLGLFLTFLVAAGGLVLKASRVLRFSAGKSNSLRALTFALDRMSRDASGAQLVSSPAAMATSNTLALTIVDPDSPDRLFANPGPPNFPVLPLNVAPHMLDISYKVGSERLSRTVQKGGATLSVAHVAESVQQLQCTRLAGGLLELKILAKEERGTRTVSTAVPLPVGVP
jgi:hypothetical protein